jgi:hypothetical protein
VKLPNLGVQADVSFIVDTGADRSVLMPGDAMRMGIDYRRLRNRTETVGIGGTSRGYQETALLAFAEPGKCVYVYQISLAVAQRRADLMDVPSLLGRDILDTWRMIYDPANGVLEFEVISSDHQLPL